MTIRVILKIFQDFYGLYEITRTSLYVTLTVTSLNANDAN